MSSAKDAIRQPFRCELTSESYAPSGLAVAFEQLRLSADAEPKFVVEMASNTYIAVILSCYGR